MCKLGARFVSLADASYDKISRFHNFCCSLFCKTFKNFDVFIYLRHIFVPDYNLDNDGCLAPKQHRQNDSIIHIDSVDCSFYFAIYLIKLA